MRPTFICFVLGGFMGCAGGNNQLATCQAEKEQLLTTIRTQRDSNKALGEQVASLESRLDQAERALAQTPGAARFSQAADQPPAVSKAAGANKAATLSKPASLSWRSPEEKSATAPAPSGEKAAVHERLANLARADQRVKLDRAAAVARIELPLVFHQQTAALTAEDKRQLDDMARLLKTKEAKELRVVVAANDALGGKDERAKAVIDYLDRHGIARERLTGTGTRGDASGEGLVMMEIVRASGPVAAAPAGDAAKRR